MRSPLLERMGSTAVIFDLDGVLVDSMPFHYEAYRQVLAGEGLQVTREDIYLREGQGTPDVLRALSKANGWNLSEERIRELAGRRREIFWHIYEHRVFPGVPELLAWLSEAGYALAVVSGATQQSLHMCLNQQVIDAAGTTLSRWFSVVVSGTAVPRGKPHPDPYLKALQELGTGPHQTLVVENAPMGIQAATAAGCPCVALETTLPAEYLRGAGWILPDHSALARWLREGQLSGTGTGGASSLRPASTQSSTG